MNSDIIRAALVDLERELEHARGAKSQIENIATNTPTDGGVFEEPELALASILTDLYETLLVVLEAAGLPETRDRLLEKWGNLNVDKTTYDPQYDYAKNKAYEYLSTLIESLRSIVADAQSPADSYEIAQLETILRRTPVLLRRRGCVPQRELDIQKVMQDYLEAFFTEYRRSVRIPGVLRDFDPDGGVRNLRAAIEFKYAATKQEVARALGGIFEDVSGYSGSRDWTRFYTVIYQTEAFESEDRVRSELTRAGAFTWKAILVTGAGQRGTRKKKKAPSDRKGVA